MVAPTVVYVNGVAGGGLLTSADEPSAGGSWEPKDEVEVEWHGSWWPAVILEKRRGHWLVHYEGYETDWDEVVGGERIRARQVELLPEEPDDPTDEDP